MRKKNIVHEKRRAQIKNIVLQQRKGKKNSKELFLLRSSKVFYDNKINF